jgi:hypothetical protein
MGPQKPVPGRYAALGSTTSVIDKSATPARSFKKDQPSFREAIYESDIRIATLPSEYCFRIHTPDYARGAVKILHGRWSYSDLGAEPGAVLARLGPAHQQDAWPAGSGARIWHHLRSRPVLHPPARAAW